MTCKPLAGKKIAVLMESEYVPHEINCYKERFGVLGAQVDFMSRLWGKPSAKFINDVDPSGEDRNIYEFEVKIDFQDVNVNDYAAVLMAANYCSVRLRYFQPPACCPVDPQQTRTAPAVEFFAQAMDNPTIVKGALCHGLWILTPRPDLLKGRRVICHEVVLADIANAGVIYESSPNNVVVDRDLVTAHSASDVEPYVDTIVQQITARQPEPKKEYQPLF